MKDVSQLNINKNYNFFESLTLFQFKRHQSLDKNIFDFFMNRLKTPLPVLPYYVNNNVIPARRK